MKICVAIDGPAGAGKSTIAKLVAKEFNLMYINTGAMYRAVALRAKENNLNPENVDEILNIVKDMKMKFENDDLILDGENIQDKITMQEIRSIMDGRDIGTVVLKDSPFKFFLTATAEERADRRYKELQQRNIECNYDEILKDIIERDYKDSHRAVDPLKKADDAIEVDTTGLNIQEVTKVICDGIKAKLK